MDESGRGLSRRRFIRSAGSLAMAGVASAQPANISIAFDPHDRVVDASVRWAAGELKQRLTDRGASVTLCDTVAQASPGSLCILAAGSKSKAAAAILTRSRLEVPGASEALAIVPGRIDSQRVLLVCGHDSRGLMYGLLDLADRLQNSDEPLAALALEKPFTEQPSNAVRSVTRLFTSDVEDKPWYNDREMWPQYLSMLATQRFNRFNLALGIGYDFIRRVTDAYFLFSYPFLLSVPGYNVRVPQLPDSERDSNLRMLKFISEQTAARGMEFQLGLWMHGYEWIDSPNANYTIEGITKENHGAYCRDAVRLLLQECPAISGITFRIHGESGVAEGSDDFWRTVFDGVATCGRTVRLDMHAKGMDQSMLDIAVATRLPITVSPKFWAEHLGMTYHQADIRTLEKPHPAKNATGLMRLSAGSRSFLRYGYGDLLREDRQWKVVHRIWPGTQRVLLWGDPVTASYYSLAFSFCGSDGVEICEPLSFKGRRGSGHPGGRCAYQHASLKPRWDWEKYLYTYRVLGRLLYNADAQPDVCRRYLDCEFKSGSEHIGQALANASRILPIVTTAHAPSAGNNTYWPELYFNQSLVDAAHPGPYTDTPAPKIFGNVSPLDPELFSRINDCADQLLTGEKSGKYSPLEVAQWIEDYAEAAAKHLAQAESAVQKKDRPEYRRLSIDVSIQVGLGRFFAAKFRSGVLYRIYTQTRDQAALKECLRQYRLARNAWSALANRAKGVYMSDITLGELPQLRGHWLDRLPAMDRDIAVLEEGLTSEQDAPSSQAKAAIRAVLTRPPRAELSARHEPPVSFTRGQALTLSLLIQNPVVSARLYYRHVDQAESYESAEMVRNGVTYQAAIPAAYTESMFPLQYFFEVKPSQDAVSLYPGLSRSLTRQPYFVVSSPLRSA